MKNTKRVLLLLLCAILAVSLLAGCKKKPSDTDPGTDPNAGTETQETFDYSRDLTDEGFWKGITATDYVTLPSDYDSFVAKRADLLPTEDDLKAEIDKILQSYQYTVDVTERTAARNDTVDIDFEGRLADGTTFEGMSGNAPELVLGSGGMIPGFEDAIIDADAFVGDEFEIDVTFPDPYPNNTDLSGKDAVFKIKINKISETIIPELTDAFVAEKYQESEGMMTVAEFRDALTTALTDQNLLAKLQSHIDGDSIVSSVPESMMTYQQDSNYFYYRLLAKSYADNNPSYGYTADDWFTMLTNGCTTKEDFDEMNEEVYTNMCRTCLVMQAIAEKDGLSVSREDVDEYFSANMGLDEYSDYEEYYGMGYLKMIILNEKVLAHCYENARIAD